MTGYPSPVSRVAYSEDPPMRKFLIALTLVAASFAVTAAVAGANTMPSCC